MNIYTPAAAAGPAAATDALADASIPAMLLRRAAADPGRAILRKKDRGIWKQVTWAEMETHARHVGLGLVESGLAPGDRAAVLAETSPDWTYADLGIMGAGGVSVGIHPTAAPAQVAALLRDSGAVVLFVQNEEQLDKALEIREACPALRRIVVFAMTGLRDLGDAMCESFAALRARGAAYDAAHPAAWRDGIAAIAGDDLALLITTAGTAGAPKLAMLTHRAILLQVANGAAVMDQREGDERLAFLPMAHVSERITGLYQALYSGTISNYAEDADTVLENLREVQPTVQGGVPRFWQRFHARVTIDVAHATWLQRVAYRWAIGVGLRRADAHLAGGGASMMRDAAFRLAYRLVLRNIRLSIGIDRLRWGFVVGAPSSPELIRWYLALGVVLHDTYGMTECGGLATWTPPGATRLCTVGRPVPHAEVAVSAEGEIVIRGEHLFRGYWNQPELTVQVLRDGWFYTGDSGAMDGDHLRVTDRLGDLIVTAAGRTVAPSAIEAALKVSPYIADAMVIGDGRSHLACLVLPDHDNLERWAQDHGIAFTSFASLVQSDAVRGLIAAEVDRVNAGTGLAEPVRGFRLIEQRLAAEDPELTPTMTLRRGFVREKYAALIETMYREP